MSLGKRIFTIRKGFVIAILYFCVATLAQSQTIGSSKVTHSDYRKEMGFDVSGGIAQASRDGVINYSLRIREPFNETLGVVAVLRRKDGLLARFPLRGIDHVVKGKKEGHIFECELSPEMAADAKFVFQLFPNTEKVTFCTVELSTWPVMIVKTAKDYNFVPLKDVTRNLTPPQSGQTTAPQ